MNNPIHIAKQIIELTELIEGEGYEDTCSEYIERLNAISGCLPYGFDPQDVSPFTDFVSDHIKHFNAVPLEYEALDGKIYDTMETWNMALRMGLTDLISKG